MICAHSAEIVFWRNFYDYSWGFWQYYIELPFKS